jgi:hypothetical protein
MRLSTVRLLSAAVLCLGFLMPGGAGAQDIAAPERAAIRAMISGQLEAFRREDGAAAYSFAAPAIQGMFPSVDQFMAMVRSNYGPVYHPRAVTFGDLYSSPDGFVQKVYLTGPGGQNWLALYSLERQPDGSWKISGCTLARADAPNI